ncbi:hypothetical protein GGF44_003196, partial [Coemansia sp. RSA 1694]
ALDGVSLDSAASPMTRRMVDDTAKRLALLDERLPELDAAVVHAVCSIAMLIERCQLSEALSAHRDLMQAGFDAELKWLVGVKRVIELQQKSTTALDSQMSQHELTIKAPDEVKSYPATMKVYTRTGDKGTSSLFTGERRAKDDAVFDALGNTDELSSMLGLAIAYLQATPADTLIPRLEAIQCLLQDVGSNVATPLNTEKQQPGKIRRTRFDSDGYHCTQLEQWIDELSEGLPVHRSFILPSGGLAASTLHVARTICRRAERSLVPLKDDIDKETMVFVNRLSDFLFVAARWVAMAQGVPEKIYVHQQGRSTEFDK